MELYEASTVQSGIEEYLRQFEFEIADEKLAETIRKELKRYLENYMIDYKLVVSVSDDSIKVQLKYDVSIDFIVRKKEKKIKTKIIRNAAECSLCHNIIESTFRHDFVRCECGAIFVDGGKDYLRRGGELKNIIEMSETEEIKE